MCLKSLKINAITQNNQSEGRKLDAPCLLIQIVHTTKTLCYICIVRRLKKPESFAHAKTGHMDHKPSKMRGLLQIVTIVYNRIVKAHNGLTSPHHCKVEPSVDTSSMPPPCNCVRNCAFCLLLLSPLHYKIFRYLLAWALANMS